MSESAQTAALDRRGIAPAAWAAMAIAALVLFGFVAFAVWLSALNTAAVHAVASTKQARDQVTELSESIAAAETGQRGYLLTGRTEYLAPYEAAAPQLLGKLDSVIASLPNDSDARHLADRLRGALTAKLNELARTVALERAGDHAGALAIVRTDAGRLQMDELRRVTAALTEVLDNQQSERMEAIGARGQLLVVLDTIGALLAAVLVWFVARAIRRTLRVLRVLQAGTRRANLALKRANDGLETEVARRTAELQGMNDEVQRFAYIVSHDLRAPLVNIMGFTGELETVERILRRHMGAPETTSAWPEEVTEAVTHDLPEAIRFIRSSTGKMEGLIAAILRLSREGRRLLQPEPLAMEALVRNALDALAHQVQQAEASVSVAKLPDLVGDRLAIEQIIGNLLDNALKYRDPSRPLRLEVRGRAEGVRRIYEIEDNGRGIAERDQERVFELFRRAGPSGVVGDGVGLAHVRALARRLGGTVTFESKPGLGTVFRVNLPAVAADAAARAGEMVS